MKGIIRGWVVMAIAVAITGAVYASGGAEGCQAAARQMDGRAYTVKKIGVGSAGTGDQKVVANGLDPAGIVILARSNDGNSSNNCSFSFGKGHKSHKAAAKLKPGSRFSVKYSQKSLDRDDQFIESYLQLVTSK